MSYEISEQLLSYNRSGEPLQPQGFVIHSTATPGATAQNEYAYYNSGNRQASVHYFADWIQIIKTIPENEVAWGCGPTGNHKFLQIEMCEPNPHALNIPANSCFQEVWKRTVWLVADTCIRYGWDQNIRAYIWSHSDVSNTWGETNHIDPLPYLKQYGKTWDQLLQAIDSEIANQKKGKQQGDVIKVDKAILIFSQDDFPAAKGLMNKIGNVPVIFRNPDLTAPSCINAVKLLFIVGGNDSNINHPNKIVLSGDEWYDTVDAVANYIKSH